jgi:hypothetical protein
VIVGSNVTDINVEEEEQYFNYYISIDGVLFQLSTGEPWLTLVKYPTGRQGNVTLPPKSLSEYYPYNGISIGSSAFSGAKNIEEITIQGNSDIEEGGFGGCQNLTKVTLADDVFIWDTYYTGYENLTQAYNWFGNCPNLKEINVTNPDNECIYSIDGVLFSKRARFYGGTFHVVEEVTKLLCYPIAKTEIAYTVPKGVISIGSYAFNQGTFPNNNLKLLTISEDVNTIEDISFILFGPSSINLLGTTPPWLYLNFPDESVNKPILYVPNESVDVYKAASGWRVFKNIFPINAMPITTEKAVTLSWSSVNNAQYYKHSIFRDEDKTQIFGEYSVPANNNVSAYGMQKAANSDNLLSYTVTGLSANTTYYYTFQAIDANGAIIKTYSDLFTTKASTGIYETHIAEKLHAYIVNEELQIVNGKYGEDVQIYDIAGRIVMNNIQLTKNNSINVSALSKGIYVVKAGMQTVKFVKE